MQNTHKTQIIIATIGLLGVITSAVIAKYEIFFNSSSPIQDKYIAISHPAYFKKGAVTCTELQYIKDYLLYKQTGNERGVLELNKAKLCQRSISPVVNVIVLDIKGEFVKVGAESNRHMATTWILYDDLMEYNITTHSTMTRYKNARMLT